MPYSHCPSRTQLTSTWYLKKSRIGHVLSAHHIRERGRAIYSSVCKVVDGCLTQEVKEPAGGSWRKINHSSDAQESPVYGTQPSGYKIKVTGDPRRTAVPKKSDVPGSTGVRLKESLLGFKRPLRKL